MISRNLVLFAIVATILSIISSVNTTDTLTKHEEKIKVSQSYKVARDRQRRLYDTYDASNSGSSNGKSSSSKSSGTSSSSGKSSSSNTWENESSGGNDGSGSGKSSSGKSSSKSSNTNTWNTDSSSSKQSSGSSSKWTTQGSNTWATASSGSGSGSGSKTGSGGSSSGKSSSGKSSSGTSSGNSGSSSSSSSSSSSNSGSSSNGGGWNTPHPTRRPTWNTPNPTWRPTPRPLWNTPNPTPKPTPRPTPKPTLRATPRPTQRPTEIPTEIPTIRPTNRPTPGPTPKPSPRPTFNPTSDPTVRPTPRPTPRPSPRPTPRPTSHPTPQPSQHPTPQPSNPPTPRPTPRPTNIPTGNPTAKPTHAYCQDIDFDLGLAFIVSNGCQLDNNQCTAMREFLTDIIERTHNDQHVQTIIIPHETGDDYITGSRDELLNGISSLSCSTDGEDAVNFQGALMDANLMVGELGDIKKIIIISFCLDTESTDTCSVGEFLSSDVEITVVNGGQAASNANQFQCLLDTVRVNDNYYEIDNINTQSLLNTADDIQDRICSKHTIAPTGQPSSYPTTWISPSPTMKPTIHPTTRPTPRPSSAPVAQPVEGGRDPCDDINELECQSDTVNGIGESICGEHEAGDCMIYHDYAGCDQCSTGTFKLNDDYPCVNCQEYTGIGCKFCDLGGCQQCEENYELVTGDCGLRYCIEQVCIPYIELPYNSATNKWYMISDDDNIHYEYSGLYEWDNENLYFKRHDNNYIILIEQLFNSISNDNSWYLVIKSINDYNYQSAIYYKYPTNEWGDNNNNKDPTTTVAGTNPSNEWECVPTNEYSSCNAYTQIFQLFDGCTGSSNSFCNGQESNFPGYIDCSSGSAQILSNNASTYAVIGKRNVILYQIVLLAMVILAIMF